MDRFRVGIGVVVVVALCAASAWVVLRGRSSEARPDLPGVPTADAPQARMDLYRELQPVALTNCTLQRYGERHDGGYLLCANLLESVDSAYSYGISGYDGWGCAVSKELGVRVHQYDCFNLTEPACPGGDTVFHPECIAGEPHADADGRLFDTLHNHMAANGDTGRTLVVKMDVEGAEWESLLQTPAEVLARIDQIAIELHGIDADVQRYLEMVRKLKESFHVAHLHFNNYSCVEDMQPFPAYAYEVLFVNKRLARPDPRGEVKRPHPLDAPNNPEEPDCQYAGRAPVTTSTNMPGRCDNENAGAPALGRGRGTTEPGGVECWTPRTTN